MCYYANYICARGTCCIRFSPAIGVSLSISLLYTYGYLNPGALADWNIKLSIATEYIVITLIHRAELPELHTVAEMFPLYPIVPTTEIWTHQVSSNIWHL